MGTRHKKPSYTPLDLSKLPADGGDRAEAFIRAYCVYIDGPLAGRPADPADFQLEIIHDLYKPAAALPSEGIQVTASGLSVVEHGLYLPDPTPGDHVAREIEQAYLQLPRKNAKSTLASWLAEYELAADFEESGLVLSLGPTENQARIIPEMVRKMIERRHIEDSLHVYGTHIDDPATQSSLVAKTIAPAGAAGSAEERLQGFRPTFGVADEVHVYPSRDPWDAVLAGQASVTNPLMLGTSTPGETAVSAAFEIYRQARSGAIPGFKAYIFEAPDDDDLDISDPAVWAACNPGMVWPGRRGGWITLKHVQKEFRTMPEHKFRRYRLGQWTAAAASWFPVGAWAAAAKPRIVKPGEKIRAMFDGSHSGDSTAIVGCTEDNHIFVIGLWERPAGAAEGWRVPRDEVHERVKQMFKTWKVKSFWCDPPYWQREIVEWQKMYGERIVLEWPTYVRSRMAPACTAFYSAVMEDGLTHDGDPALARHVSNCVTIPTGAGDVISKSNKDSPDKIDLAVGAVGAYYANLQGQNRARITIY